MDPTIVVASVGAVSAVACAWLTARTHREMRTNHGIRAGTRIENLTTDVLWLRQNVVTNAELKRHADNDVMVAEQLANTVAETKQEMLDAIHKERGN